MLMRSNVGEQCKKGEKLNSNPAEDPWASLFGALLSSSVGWAHDSNSNSPKFQTGTESLEGLKCT